MLNYISNVHEIFLVGISQVHGRVTSQVCMKYSQWDNVGCMVELHLEWA